MKELLRSGIFKMLLICNGFFFGMTMIAKAGKGIANFVGQCPVIGGFLKKGVTVIFTPFASLSKLFPVVLVIDAIILVLCIILAIKKKRQQKTATNDLGEAIGSEKTAKGFADLMKAFK